jgi:anti-sigma factor RsiW
LSRHIDHLLAAYVERQLKPEQAARVYQHSRQCPRCWARLAHHERLADELRLSLGQWPSLHPNRVRQLWLATSAAPFAPPHRHNTSLLLPIMISLVLLVTPLTTGVSSMMSSSALAATASHAPGEVAAQAWPVLASTSIFPLPDAEQVSLTVAATPAVDETPLPIEPVPLAPSTP